MNMYTAIQLCTESVLFSLLHYTAVSAHIGNKTRFKLQTQHESYRLYSQSSNIYLLGL